MSSKKSKDEPDLDPYDVMGVDPDASDAAISKAYKKLALKLHPDKQANKSPTEAEAVAKRFHDVQQARAFLLDSEFQEARRKYDAKRASIQRRRQADAKRKETMNEKRKRQLDELKKREAEAERNKKKKKSSSKNRHDDELIEKLKEDGRRMRDEKARQQAEAAEAAARQKAKSGKQDRKEKERLLQNRQVRLKWSRKKLDTSPSEHSLATLLSKFGTVEEVEMIGGKGNQALITFEFPSSCRPCVDCYKNSEQMRAFFVGKRKEVEEARDAAADQQAEQDTTTSTHNQRRDQESLYDRKLRQAEEREQLLQEMETEEVGVQTGRAEKKDERGSTEVSSRCVAVNFPSAYHLLDPIQRLEKAEEDILGKILSGDALARLKELHA